MNLNIQDTFTKENPADPVLKNTRRQVFEAVFSYVSPKKTSNPKVIHVSKEMAHELGISEEETQSEFFKNVFTGNEIYPNTTPFAMCYGGHQFGNWAGQLGDGRAINLFEIENKNKNWKVQLKGAGETPYSRTADGLAVLRSSIREYLCSEAMFHLGVPTTRALSLSLSGDAVLRDVLYDGNSKYEKGAIVARVAPSFLRFGNYEIFAARNDIKNLRNLVDYTIKYHFPYLGKPSKKTYINFFKEVSKRTLEMIIHWQRVGFVHGVMNTDNMSILGLTIDYGPYGWLDIVDSGWTPNTSDNASRRYAFGNQPNIGAWNMMKLAEALYPLVNEVDPLQAGLDRYRQVFQQHYTELRYQKMGFTLNKNEEKNQCINRLYDLMEHTETDLTVLFRSLSHMTCSSILTAESDEAKTSVIRGAFYQYNSWSTEMHERWAVWLTEYAQILNADGLDEPNRQAQMLAVNPKYIIRNYLAQMAIDGINGGDDSMLHDLLRVLKRPYDEHPEHEAWAGLMPDWARDRAGCSALSCSS